MEFNLKFGGKFRSKDGVGEFDLVLHDVVVDNAGERWAIGLDDCGVPYTIFEGDIDPIPTTVNLPKKGKK